MALNRCSIFLLRLNFPPGEPSSVLTTLLVDLKFEVLEKLRRSESSLSRYPRQIFLRR